MKKVIGAILRGVLYAVLAVLVYDEAGVWTAVALTVLFIGQELQTTAINRLRTHDDTI